MGKLIDFVRLLATAIAALALAITLAGGPASAEDATAPAPMQLKGEDQLDNLFAQLGMASDARSAHQLEQQIWTIWLTPADPDAESLMSEALDAREVGDLPEAIRVLGKLVAAYPNYAEGWNQLATMYYMTGDLEDSLADCAKVLELEPRHFGALSGRALIYLALGKRDLALKDATRAVTIHPFLPERQLFPELQIPTHT